MKRVIAKIKQFLVSTERELEVSLKSSVENMNSTDTITIKEPRWYPYVAVVAGVLAALAGIVTVKANFLSHEASYYSNQAVLAQARASDAWAEYQADSMKAHIAETAILTTSKPEAVKQLEKDVKKYRDRQPPLKKKAEENEQDREEKLLRSSRRINDRDTLTFAGVVVQLAIGLSSIAAMTKRHRVFLVTLIFTFVGVLIASYALIIPYFH